MKKIPFLILLAFCLSSLFAGIFCCESFPFGQQVAKVNAAAEPVVTKEIATAQNLENYVKSYGSASANDEIVISNSENQVLDMSGITLEYSIGNEESPFCGTFDGTGHTISNLTIDMTKQTKPNSEVSYAGLFGKLGEGAKVCNISFQNLTIKTSSATTIYAGVVAFGEKCEISNVKLLSGAESQASSLEVGTASTIYCGGIFGFAQNSKISRVQIAQNVDFKLSKANSTYVGGLVGRAIGTTIDNIQISSVSDGTLTMKVEGNNDENAFDSNMNFGGMAGALENSQAVNVICRTNSFGQQWSFSNNDKKIHNIGGVVGSMSGSSFIFGVTKAKIDVLLEDAFEGTVNVGGFAGKISQNQNRIENLAMKNDISAEKTSQNATLNCGEVVGKVASPVPAAQNIAYVHYAQENKGIFGDQGRYEFKDVANNDFISSSGSYDLDALQMRDGKCTYFSQQIWNTLFGDWDFEDIWYVSAQKIYLQDFFSEFLVSVDGVDERALVFNGINGEKNVLTTSNLEYGQQVRLSYSFKTNDGTNMKQFYDLSTLKFNGADTARFLQSGTGYRLSGNDNFDVEMKEDGGEVVGFDVLIKSLSMATSGRYSVSVSTKKFSATISTRLYEGEDDETWNETVVYPGLVQADNGPLKETLTLTNLVYGKSYKIRTSAKSAKDGEIFAPTNEWFLVAKDGELKKIDSIQEGVLLLNFGEGDFVGDLEIFAKYTNDSCTGIFTIDEGVQKIELSNGNILIENNGDKKPISKDDPKLSLDIFIFKNYAFDQERFMDELGYKSTVDGREFCKFLSKEELENVDCYHFQIDMTSLNWEDVQINNIFSVQVKTTLLKTNDNSWIWWVVGGVCGAIVLVGIVILIVWLVRRNGFGGGKGSKKINKKNYKQMYY